MKTNVGLVQHCNKMLQEKCRYFLGTYCNKFTHTLMRHKFLQLTKYAEDWGAYITSNLDLFEGKRVTDCGGIIKGYLWWKDDDPVYTASTDRDVDTMFAQAKVLGKIATIPEIPGIIVRYPGHAGVYIGNGEVIEARGTKEGVCKTWLQYRAWTHWFEHPDLVYLVPAKKDSLDETLQKVKNAGIINSIDYWKNSIKSNKIKYLEALFTNIAEYIKED